MRSSNKRVSKTGNMEFWLPGNSRFILIIMLATCWKEITSLWLWGRPQQMDVTSGPYRHMLVKEGDGRRYRLADGWGRTRLRKQKFFSAAL